MSQFDSVEQRRLCAQLLISKLQLVLRSKVFEGKGVGQGALSTPPFEMSVAARLRNGRAGIGICARSTNADRTRCSGQLLLMKRFKGSRNDVRRC